MSLSMDRLQILIDSKNMKDLFFVMKLNSLKKKNIDDKKDYILFKIYD